MSESNGKSVKIALIDDNEDYLFTMGTFLTRNGFITVTANQGAKGLELIQREQPDLILLDVMMESSFAGFEVWKALQADAVLKEIPVIAVSALQNEMGVRPERYMDQDYFHPSAFLDKPVDRELLLKTIAEVLKAAEEHKKRPRWKKALEKFKE
jgi:two-component system, OmpR family, phosphate regulon response regulator PhoB